MTRGRDAYSPIAIPPRGWLDIAVRVVRRSGSLNIGLLAAGTAFYGLLSLFPAITAGVALVGLVYDPSQLIDEAGWLLAALPDAARRIIEGQLTEVAGATGSSLGVAALLSLAIALWSSSNATASLVQGLNVIYEENEKRNFLKLRALVVALTLGIIFGLASMIVIVAAIPAAISFLGAGAALTQAALVLRWPLMFGLGVAGIATLYRVGPHRRAARWRWITPGAVVACGLWVAGTYGFSYYVQNFASYNETFGALAGVIVLLTWLWLSAFIILLGAELDAEIEAQTARDSTVGAPRPMGERGAVKADTLGPAYGEDEDAARNHEAAARDGMKT